MNEEGYLNEEGYTNVARFRSAGAMMVFVRRFVAHDGGNRVTQSQELSRLKNIGEFYSGERATHDREQLRFADRGGGKLFVDRGYDGVTKVLAVSPKEGASNLVYRRGSRRGPQGGRDVAGRAERGWVVAASSLRLDLAPPDIYV